MDFQQIILTLNEYWSKKGCIVWQPHNAQVGAGTSNPATALRALGPEPWNVAYPEPSVRPADGRYGENPNRWGEYYQYQVILKPAPANNLELYLQSLEALGIDSRKHDIRFVEDNWENPSLAAKGLGWEVWLDGLEVTQYTYFQQMCGMEMNPVCVEITYGLERLATFLQGVSSISNIRWFGDLTYADLHLQDEIDYCHYNFETADTERLRQIYDECEAESRNAIEHGLVLPSHDYLLRCSHLFNVMDARGAIGVTQRAWFFARMRDLAKQIAETYLAKRAELGYPLLQRTALTAPSLANEQGPRGEVEALGSQSQGLHYPPETLDAHTSNNASARAQVSDSEVSARFVLELGVEELPAQDVTAAVSQLRESVPAALREARLDTSHIEIDGTPRRIAVIIDGLPLRQLDNRRLLKGPNVAAAYTPDGAPTKAAEGFARGAGIPVEALVQREFDGKMHICAEVVDAGKSTADALAQIFPGLIAALKFDRTMRWNETQLTFSRPLRSIIALLGDQVVPISYAGIEAGTTTVGLRSRQSPTLTVTHAEDYHLLMQRNAIILSAERRRSMIAEQVGQIAREVQGGVPDMPDLLDETANLVENPIPLRGSFDPSFLELPPDVLITVMRKHQRYFPIMDENGQLLPYFITITNGNSDSHDEIRRGNEAVLRARFSDARYFYQTDTKQKLDAFVPKLSGLMFQKDLGSYLEKTKRLQKLVPQISELLALTPAERKIAERAADIAKADLVTNMVIEFTDLQGIIGMYYAGVGGEDTQVAAAIAEHYQPRDADDSVSTSPAGSTLAIADRLDSIVGLFAAGLKPSSTTDPYGLRRAAFGVLRTLLERDISFSLREGIRAAAALQPIPASDAVQQDAAAFLARRLEGMFEEQGYRHDLSAAVLAEQSDNPAGALAALKRLQAWSQREEFSVILRAYARAARIVRKVEDTQVIHPQALDNNAITRLHEAVQAAKANLEQNTDIDRLLATLAELQDPINTFFDAVMVMHEQPERRATHLAILQQVAALTRGQVDLSKIEGF